MTRYVHAVISISCVCFLAGCNEPIDLTKNHIGSASLCKLHHCQMQAERFYVYGEIVYYPDYAMICEEQFPNHGSHRYNGEKEGTPRDKEVIDDVCPECDLAYFQYWKDKRKVDTSQ